MEYWEVGESGVARETMFFSCCGAPTGDYFGIYLEEPVTTFPYTICANPMYWGKSDSGRRGDSYISLTPVCTYLLPLIGSTMIFLGKALYNASPAGLFLTAFVYGVYTITTLVEE